MRTHVLVPRHRSPERPFAARLFGDFDALFDELWRVGTPGARAATQRTVAPRMDWVDDENEIRVRAEMPGLDDAGISVSLEHGVLTIEGRRSQDEERDEGRGYLRRETFRGSYQRKVALPEEVDEDAVRADYRSGILTVTLPKMKAEVRTIPVSTG